MILYADGFASSGVLYQPPVVSQSYQPRMGSTAPPISPFVRSNVSGETFPDGKAHVDRRSVCLVPSRRAGTEWYSFADRLEEG